MIAILDEPSGGAQPVQRAFARLGLEAEPVSAISDLERAAKIVIPAGESFPKMIRWLRETRLVGPLLQAMDQGRPILGISQGMHLLFDVSHEDGQHTGLGLVHGKVIPIDLGRHPAAQHFVLPHRGWNEVRWVRDCPLSADVPTGEYFYFHHSAHAEPLDAAEIGGTCNHGIDFCALAWHDRVFGVQFLPEKSEAAGLKILANFAGL